MAVAVLPQAPARRHDGRGQEEHVELRGHGRARRLLLVRRRRRGRLLREPPNRLHRHERDPRARTGPPHARGKNQRSNNAILISDFFFITLQ